jgi:hypothetical protein
MNSEKKSPLETPALFFHQGVNELPDPDQTFKKKVKELCNVKHLNFLFGAGTSAAAIPTMTQMKSKLDTEINSQAKDIIVLYKSVNKDNLEDLLSILYAKRFYLEGTEDTGELGNVEKLIKYIQDFMFREINVSFEEEESKKALELYKTFYSKLSLRNKDVSRINVFTTNNDLFNESALDFLNINYNNGFGGGLERYFNPARFRYTYSKKVDLNMEKFEPIDNMVYLYKLHGSINWIENKGNALFDIKEIPINGGDKASGTPALIYPTPLKQNQSLGAPYADLIREFQAKLTLPNSVVFIIGYSFSDEHLNNIIYQALASNTSMSIVIFGDPKSPLSNIADSRIYRFYGKIKTSNGEDETANHFKYIVNHIFPDVDQNKEKTLLEEFTSKLAQINSKKTDENR